jgi:glutamate-5-semialdehyde dehydrogenase
MSSIEELQRLTVGTPLVFAGNKVVRVSADLAERFRAGDSLAIVQTTGDVLLVPRAERELVDAAIARSLEAFERLNRVEDEAILAFFEAFASRLENDEIWSAIREVNDEDVAAARRRGRSTTRLVADEAMRSKMTAGLRGWLEAPSRRGRVLECVQHEGWRTELVGAALGPVGFVFEGRPNVLADAMGVLTSGNTVLFRIGSDALGTARALMKQALQPSLDEAGLPEGTVTLIDSPAHAAGWALFSNPGLALAVARGSGSAVAQLGALARQAGIAVSLHGTGGAWIVAACDAPPAELRAAVVRSLDRKVCNSLNTCCIEKAAAPTLVPELLAGLEEAGAARGQAFRIHVEEVDRAWLPAELFDREVSVLRAEGAVSEKQATLLPGGCLGREWEWEDTPEVTLKVAGSIDEAVELFNRQSPRFAASLISSDPAAHESFFRGIDSPFVGDSHTRWVDGQVALGTPELGLSNWQSGRLFGRGGVLSGDGVFTIRTRARREDASG